MTLNPKPYNFLSGSHKTSMAASLSFNISARGLHGRFESAAMVRVLGFRALNPKPYRVSVLGFGVLGFRVLGPKMITNSPSFSSPMSAVSVEQKALESSVYFQVPPCLLHLKPEAPNQTLSVSFLGRYTLTPP